MITWLKVLLHSLLSVQSFIIFIICITFRIGIQLVFEAGNFLSCCWGPRWQSRKIE